MPHSAAVVADFVLPPARIGEELARIAGHPYRNHAGAVQAGHRPAPDSSPHVPAED
jgi:hypothetical protein